MIATVPDKGEEGSSEQPLGTVKTHVHNICGKLGAPNRIKATAKARELGLL